MTTRPRRSRRKLVLIVALLLIGGIAAWVVYDLYAPRTARLREFNPDEVARLETAMWRSYYEREPIKLFTQLAELLRTQYNMTFTKSAQVAYYAANAASVFQKGKNRSEHERALPNLIKFYEALRKTSDTPFDPNRAARLELEWWIIHRERLNYRPGDLARALAELQSELYQMPIDAFMEHGRLRAEAMTVRDDKAAAGGVTEADWARIDELLRQSWRSLKLAVNK